MSVLWRPIPDRNCSLQFCTASRYWLEPWIATGIRLLAGFVLMLLFTLTPSVCKSLGLGNLNVQTSLDQPLRGNIELLAVAPDELDQIEVNLATRQDFEWVGIERTADLEQLRFAPYLNKSGLPTIAVTTARPLTKYYLNFLIEVRWSGGRLLREYSIKLETAPGYESMPAEIKPPSVPDATKQTPVSRLPAPQVIGSMEHADVDAGASSSPPLDTPIPQPRANPYTTVRGDTLYEIAGDYLPAGDVSLRQMAVALYRANPDAFNNQDINQLKTNAPLRIPELDEIKELSRQPLTIESKDRTQKSARSQLQAENEKPPEVPAPKPEQVAEKPAESDAGIDSPAVEPEPVTAQEDENKQEALNAQDDDMTPQQLAETEAYLEIVTEETQFVDPDPQTVAVDDYIASLENTAALTQELAESRNQEISELKTRIQELESMIARQERLITLQTTQMAEIHKAAIANTQQSTPIIWQWVLIFLIALTIMLLVLVLRLYRRP